MATKFINSFRRNVIRKHEILETEFQKLFPRQRLNTLFWMWWQAYVSEKQIGRIVLFFSITAILIACLGFIRACCLHRRTTHQRNWRSEVLGTGFGIGCLLPLISSKLVLVALVIPSPKPRS
jgi:hypothetical protein